MSNYVNLDMPRYLRIAVDIAERIATGKIKPGDKLKGRSVLSSEYRVSPETIRRAMSILADMHVVKVSAGSGIFVQERAHAIHFVRTYRNTVSIKEIKQKLDLKFNESLKIQEELRQLSNKLLDYSRYRRGDLISQIEINVPPESPLVGKSIGECQVWQHTGATIIGVVKDNDVLVSPGPYYEFAANDKLLVVGDEDVITRMQLFLLQDLEQFSSRHNA